MLRNLIAMVGVFVFAVAASGDDAKLVTKTYDLKLILGEKGKAAGFADADAVIKLLLETLPTLRELKPGTDGAQIIERDGGKLEVRAPADAQGEVKDLLEALERLADLAVDVKAEVFEVTPESYEKLRKALPKVGRGKAGSPVVFTTGEFDEETEPTPDDVKALKEMNQILKGGRLVQTSTARFTNGIEATFSARQSVLTYRPNAAGGANDEAPKFLKEGFKLVGLPVVSADRRYVRLKLTEQSVVVTEIKKRELGEVEGQIIVAQSPILEDIGGTGSAVVDDGGTLLFRLSYAPKDKVLVVVLRPRIFIQAEEDALKK